MFRVMSLRQRTNRQSIISSIPFRQKLNWSKVSVRTLYRLVRHSTRPRYEIGKRSNRPEYRLVKRSTRTWLTRQKLKFVFPMYLSAARFVPSEILHEQEEIHH